MRAFYVRAFSADTKVARDPVDEARVHRRGLLGAVRAEAVIHLQVADEIVVERFAGRRIDPLSGKIYHVKHNPPPPEVPSLTARGAADCGTAGRSP